MLGRDLGDFGVAEPEIRRADDAIDLRRGAHADDRAGHCGMAQRPRDRDFARWCGRARCRSRAAVRPDSDCASAAAPESSECGGGNRPRACAATRSRVIVPVSRPDFIGEYTITPMLFAPQ